MSSPSKENRLMKAVQAVRQGLLSIRKAANVYNVAKSTISDRVTGRINMYAKIGVQPQLTNNEERKLIDMAANRALYGVGFSKKTFLRHVGLYAKENGKPFKRDVPTEKWWRNLKKRHGDISLRTPEATSILRHNSMTKNRISNYFSVLGKELQYLGILEKPECIWNMDETYLSLSTEPDKIVARKGAKYLHSKTGSRENITLVVCGNAAGTYMDPHLVIKGKTRAALKSWDTDHAPTGTRLSVSPTGWMKQGLSLMWFKEVFLPSIGPARPQVLIFDGHDSHHHVELIHEARQNGITLIEIPSHCSHWLQPLDRTVFGSFKSTWKTAVHSYTALTACTVTHGNFFHLFRQTWMRLQADRHLLVSGFRATGIYPFDPRAIPEQAFLPSTVNCSASVPDVTSDKGDDDDDLRLVMDLILGGEAGVTQSDMGGMDLDLEVDQYLDPGLDLDLDLDPREGEVLPAGSTVEDLGVSLLPNGDLVYNSPPMDLEPEEEDESTDQLTEIQIDMQEEPLPRHEVPHLDAINYVPPQKKKKSKFFIISSDAAFRAKVEAAAVREERERKKAERMKKRQEKTQMK